MDPVSVMYNWAMTPHVTKPRESAIARNTITSYRGPSVVYLVTVTLWARTTCDVTPSPVNAHAGLVSSVAVVIPAPINTLKSP